MADATRTVVITGASAGVGRAAARAFARRGANVALIARGATGLAAAREECEALGVRALELSVDVASHQDVDAAAELVERELGPIDVWVNNAMVSIFERFVDISPEDFERVNTVTYLGYVNGTRAALRHMLPRDKGHIIQVGSALAYRAIPLQSAYSGAKHAIEGFTESVRTELMHDGASVRLSMVQLPALNTPQFHWVKTSLEKHPMPVPPIYQPELAAEAIVWASEHRRYEVWLTGMTMATILANRIAPRLLDRILARKGFSGQQASWPIEPGRPDNLYTSVDEDRDLGAHGEFDGSAHETSIQWWANKHRAALGASAAVAALGALAVRHTPSSANGHHGSRRARGRRSAATARR